MTRGAQSDDEGSGRPQDQGRSHKRKGAPSAETTALLTRFQTAMRTELASLLDELEPTPSPQLTVDGKTETRRLPVAERAKRWELGIRLARELGAAIDPMPEPSSKAGGAPSAGGPRRSRSRDFG